MAENHLSPTAALASQLIQCPSITPQDAGCQVILKKRLEAIGFQGYLFPRGPVSNLWLRYGTQPPLFVFAGHTDVVPPGPLAAWQFPPFDATIYQSYLHGRGATDMKGAIAAMIIAVERFLHTMPAFLGSVAFLITSDEEGQAIEGTRAIITHLQQRGIKIDYALVGEASSEQQVGDQVRIGRRGSLHGKLTIQGKQGHIAFPALANNPIHQSLPALLELTQTIWDHGNAFFPPTSFQLSNMYSGEGVLNMIPGQLEVDFNFRFSTATSINTLQQQVTHLLRQHPFHFDIAWRIAAQPFLTSKNSQLTAIVKKAIYKTTGLNTILSTGGGTSDARFIAEIGADVIELGVPHETAHQINEQVKLKDLETLTDIYETLLRLLFRKKGL